MKKVVGFSQKTKRAWLDAVLDRLAQTSDEKELRAYLDEFLKDDLPGKESRAKSTGIVMRVWSSIPSERIRLRDRAVALLPRISGQERIWLHWGMTALAYPFFRDTVEVVGRLLALQDDFTTAQVQSRMLTMWGDRTTTTEAVQKLVTSLVDWEVLRSTKSKGHFLLTRKMIASPELQLWVIEALLTASAADEIEAQQLLRLPETFPFTLTVGVADLRRHESFDIHRQGLDMDMVALRRVKVDPPAKPERSPNPHVEPLNGLTLFERPPAYGAPSKKSAFAQAVEECAELLQGGHYYGCIALAQALIETAIIRAATKKQNKKSNVGTIEEKLSLLLKAQMIDNLTKRKAEEAWVKLEKVFRLRSTIPSEQNKLQQLAREHLELLRRLVSCLETAHINLDRTLFDTRH